MHRSPLLYNARLPTGNRHRSDFLHWHQNEHAPFEEAMSEEMKILHIDKKQLFSVEQDDDGMMYLRVVVGGVAMRERRVAMDEDLQSLYKADPNLLISCVVEIRRKA